MNSKFALFSIITSLAFILSQYASPQTLELFNEFRPDSSVIKKHRIKSLTVYCDYTENGLSDSSNTKSSKLMEFSFNNEGQKKYVKSVPLHNELIIFGSEGTKQQLFEYDSLQRIIYTRMKKLRADMGYRYTYDSANNIIQMDLSYDGKASTTQTFDWQKGKLIGSDRKFAETSIQANGKYIYASDGSLSRTESGTHVTEILSTRYLNLLERTVISYRKGEMVATGLTRKDVFAKRLL